MDIKATDLVTDENKEQLVEYINLLMNGNASVEIMDVNGKSYIILNNGNSEEVEGIEITDDLTVGTAIYAFSDYYPEADESQQQIIERAHTKENNSPSEDEYIIDIDVETYNGIIDIIDDAVDVFNSVTLPFTNNIKLNTYYETNKKNNLKNVITTYMAYLEDLKIKIEACLQIYEEQDESLLFLYNELVTSIFTYEYVTNTDGTVNYSNVDFSLLSYSERREVIHDWIDSLTDTYEQLYEEYQELYGKGFAYDREKFNEMCDLLASLGLFEMDGLYCSDGNLYDYEGRPVDGVGYASASGFATIGDLQYVDISRLGQIMAVCNEKNVISALRGYVYDDLSWEESGLDSIFGDHLRDWWYGTYGMSMGIGTDLEVHSRTEWSESIDENNDWNNKGKEIVDAETVFLYRYLSESTFGVAAGTSAGASFDYKDYGFNIVNSRDNGVGNESRDFRVFCRAWQECYSCNYAGIPCYRYDEANDEYIVYLPTSIRDDFNEETGIYAYSYTNMRGTTRTVSNDFLTGKKYRVVEIENYDGNNDLEISIDQGLYNYETYSLAYNDLGFDSIEAYRPFSDHSTWNGARFVVRHYGDGENARTEYVIADTPDEYTDDFFTKQYGVNYISLDGIGGLINNINEVTYSHENRASGTVTYEYVMEPTYVTPVYDKDGNFIRETTTDNSKGMYLGEEVVYNAIFDLNNYTLDGGPLVNVPNIKNKDLAVHVVKSYIASKDILGTFEEIEETSINIIEVQNKLIATGSAIQQLQSYCDFMPYEYAIESGDTEFYNNILKEVGDDFKTNSYSLNSLELLNSETLGLFEKGILSEDLNYFSPEEFAMLVYLQEHPECGLTPRDFVDFMKKPLTERKAFKKAVDHVESYDNVYEEHGRIIGDIYTIGDSSVYGFGTGIYRYFDGIVDIFNPSHEIEEWELESVYYDRLLLGEIDGSDDLLSHMPPEMRLIASACFNLESTIGNMIVPIAISAVCNIPALQGISIAGIALGEVAGLAAMGASVFGNSTESGYQRGLSIEKAYLYGAVMAIIETGSEYLLGHMFSSGMSLFDHALSEGREEFIQEYLSAGVESAFFGKPYDFSNITEDAFRSALYGAAATFLIGLGGNGLTYIYNNYSVHIPVSQFSQITNGVDIDGINTDGTIRLTNGETIGISEMHSENVSVEATAGRNSTDAYTILDANEVRGALDILKNGRQELMDKGFDEVSENLEQDAKDAAMVIMTDLIENHTMWQGNYEGVEIRYCDYDDDSNTMKQRINNIKNVIDSYPSIFKKLLNGQSIIITSQPNPYDLAMSFQYLDSAYTSAMDCEVDRVTDLNGSKTGLSGTGTIRMFSDSSLDDFNTTRGNLVHELHHAIDLKYQITPGSEWQAAMQADGVTTTAYGATCIEEDFAEAGRLFLEDPIAFMEKCPNRANILLKIYGIE